MILIFCHATFLVKGQNAPLDILYEENFDGWTSIEANGWFTYSEDSWNFIDPQDDAINFFKQSSGEEIMMLITPEWDLNDATIVDFHFKVGSSVEGMLVEVGTMTDPTDPSTFELLNTVAIEGEYDVWVTEGNETFLNGVDAVTHICFNVKGPWYTYFFLDNVVVKDDDVSANWPSFCTDMQAIPDPMGANEIAFSCYAPSTESDGDALTDLDEIQIWVNGELNSTVNDPEIGGLVETTIYVDEPGFYEIATIALNDAGASPEVMISTDWVGLDTPGMPGGVVAVKDGQQVTITWTAPTEGAHGGYYDQVVTEYILQRADGFEFSVDGDQLIAGDEITTPGTYNYKVYPFNNTGQGTEGESNTLAFYFDGYLLWEDFWVDVPALDWEIEGDGEDYEWMMSYWDLSGGVVPEMMFVPSSSSPWTGYTRMKSPVLNSSGFSALMLRFDNYAGHQGSGMYTMKVETSSDGISWNEAWSLDVLETQDGQVRMIVLDTDDVGSESFQFAFTFEGNTQYCERIIWDAIRLYDAPEADMAVLSLDFPEIIQPGDVFIPNGIIENQSYSDTDFEAVYVINNGSDDVYTETISGMLESGNTTELTFPEWTAVEGEYTGTLSVSCVDDADPDDNTMTGTFDVYHFQSARRYVVAEEATGTWCGYCPGAAMGLDELHENGWAVATIAYHSGDAYETPESVARNDFNEVGGYPTVVFNGVESVVGGSNSNSMYNTYLPIVQQELQRPTPLDIQIISFNITGNTLSAHVHIETDSPMGGESNILHAVITESHIEESWQNQDELNFVERTMLNGADGLVVDLATQSADINFELTLSEDWVDANCEFIVFVQDIESHDIYNADMMTFAMSDIVDRTTDINIWPNPSRGTVFVDCDKSTQIEIYNTNGQLVYRVSNHQANSYLNLNDLGTGLYYMQLNDGQQYETKKIVIVE
jgi:hypothetical protein